MTAPTETGPSWSRGTNPVANPTFEAPPVPSPADMPSTQPPAAAAPTTEAPEPTGKPEGQEEPPDLTKLRREAANYRTQRNEFKTAAETAAAEKAAAEKQRDDLTAILQGINKALNPGADETPDPAKLAEQLAARDADLAKLAEDKDREIRNLRVERAAEAAARKAGADVQALLDSRSFSAAVTKLDPTSETFADDLASAVTAAMEANPRLKADAPVAQSRKSGAEFPGRSGGSDQITHEQLKSMTSEQIVEAQKKGLVRKLAAGG